MSSPVIEGNEGPILPTLTGRTAMAHFVTSTTSVTSNRRGSERDGRRKRKRKP